MIRNIIKGKTILVTGGTGTIGGEIVRQVLQYDPKVVRILSRDEHKQFLMAQMYAEENKLRFLIGDIRDARRVDKAMRDVDIVFHAAALKHVPSCEYNPFEAVATNVMGTQNLVEAAMESNVEHFIGISTDKAASPNSVMGATKLLAEKIITSASNYEGGRRTIFACVRFGNVLGSRGSLVRLVQDQIINGSPVTVTDPDMCRFFISISDAVNLVFKALLIMRGGELFILKMPAIRIGDMIEVLKKIFAGENHKTYGEIKTDIIGRRPGEKKHESLMTEDESYLAYENEAMYVIMNSRLRLIQGKNFKIPYGFQKCEINEYTTKKSPRLSKNKINKMINLLLTQEKTRS
jgi:FlaA1/EpsC-like NDP-sugar epimerase